LEREVKNRADGEIHSGGEVPHGIVLPSKKKNNTYIRQTKTSKFVWGGVK